MWHQSSDFVSAVSRGAKDEFAKLGINVVAETNANFDAGKQKSDIETVEAKKPSVMLSLPVDPTATASAYRDAGKAGTCVPGTGQQIRYRDALQDAPVDVVIIPTQWRARDIVVEMQREGIAAGQVLIEHEGRLIDFLADPHPYR